MDYEPELQIVHEVFDVEDSDAEWTQEDELILLREMEERKRQLKRIKKLRKEGKSRRVPPS